MAITLKAPIIINLRKPLSGQVLQNHNKKNIFNRKLYKCMSKVEIQNNCIFCNMCA